MPLNDPAESRDLGFHFVALSSSRLLFRQPRIKAVQQQHLWPKQHINSTRMYSKYGTYRSRVRYPVYVIRTYYTVSFSYIVPGMYYRIYWRNNKKRQQENGVFCLAPSQGSDSGETPLFVGFSNLGNIVGQL